MLWNIQWNFEVMHYSHAFGIIYNVMRIKKLNNTPTRRKFHPRLMAWGHFEGIPRYYVTNQPNRM